WRCCRWGGGRWWSKSLRCCRCSSCAFSSDVVAKGLIAFSAFLVALWLFLLAWGRMPAPPGLAQGRPRAGTAKRRGPPEAVPARVSGKVRGHDVPLPAQKLDGPVFVTAYEQGQPVTAQILDGSTIAAALGKATLHASDTQRLKVDVFAARGRIATAPAPVF